jgi:hypothetical protein
MKHIQRFLDDIDGAATPEEMARVQAQVLVFVAEQIGRVADVLEELHK